MTKRAECFLKRLYKKVKVNMIIIMHLDRHITEFPDTLPNTLFISDKKFT
jgi:hypothetical protein